MTDNSDNNHGAPLVAVVPNSSNDDDDKLPFETSVRLSMDYATALSTNSGLSISSTNNSSSGGDRSVEEIDGDEQVKKGGNHAITNEEEDNESLLNLRGPQSINTRRSTQIMIEQAAAAAIVAAESNQETDSVLSEDDNVMDESDRNAINGNINRRASRNSNEDVPSQELGEDFRCMSIRTFHFIQDASIESTLSQNDPSNLASESNGVDIARGTVVLPDHLDSPVRLEEADTDFAPSKRSWEDGVLVETQSLESSAENTTNTARSLEESCSERGSFADFQQQDRALSEERQPQHELLSDSSTAVDLINDDLSIDSGSDSGAQSSSLVYPMSKSAEEILKKAGIIDDADLQQIEQFRRDKGILGEELDDGNSQASLLFHFFADFTTPSVTWVAMQKILILEEEGNYARQTKESYNVDLPTDVVVNVLEKSRVLSILWCRDYQQLLQLPKAFFLAFFRTLIRLLTNETDHEYNESSLLAYNWQEEDISLVEDSDPLFRLRTASFGNAANNSGASSLGEKSLGLSPDGNRDYSSKKDSQIYSMVRLQQCGTTRGTYHTEDSNYTARNLLRLFDVIKGKKAYRHLLAPVARLIGIICTAGVSERVLRRMLNLAYSPVICGSPVPPVARLLLIRALRSATEGASRSIFFMGKTSVRHFFSFGGGKGLSRTISGLSAWPFRNDFGMALVSYSGSMLYIRFQ